MLKPHTQMWTHLSRLHKEFPAWIATGFSDASGLRAEKAQLQNASPSDQLSGQAEDVIAPVSEQQSSTVAEQPESETDANSFAQKLQIPILNDCPNSQNRQCLQDRGQFLARQERWSELSNLIRAADKKQSRTGGGLPEADLLAYGARSDVVNAVEHALQERSTKAGLSNMGTTRGKTARQRSGENPVLIDGVMALETLRRDHPKDIYLTAIVAQAHIDIAWTWRAAAAEALPSQTQQEAQLRRSNAHFERAAALLTPLKDQSRDSAFLSAAQCALFAGQSADTMDVADAYGALIDKAPDNPRPMRALGAQMLPRANGSYAALELEARRTAARTQDQWGAGGYAWVYFDAMAIDEQACARVDRKFFLDGLQDILCTDPSQEMINLLAAYCAVTLPNTLGSSAAANLNRIEISKAARWLVRSHLRELHPLIWAHACEGFDNNARITSLRRFAAHGQAKALQCLTHIFRDEIESGHKISFTPEGFDLLPA
ncbi:hypothetical protein [Pseudophaeobacter sp.]|uniref:hypothetical protein n=1 Tax=Pseudophaeobacter sp. TaxID=1971739 RepID=UPI0032979398